MKYFVISDTHSFYTKTIEALTEKGYDKNNPEHTLILCGDAFDRGDESIQMLNFLLSLPRERFIYVRGNHEDLLQECYNDILTGFNIGYHHFTNGTIKTICNFCNIPNPYYIEYITPELTEVIKEKIGKVLDFINSVSIDYFETKHYVFTHGWIPFKTKGIYPQIYSYDKGWRRASKYRMKKSRWTNGMDALHYYNIRVPRKTVVCGHYHTSWARVNITGELKEEFPKNKADKDLVYKAFKPYMEEGIIAIDACTAYSGFVNCIVLED